MLNIWKTPQVDTLLEEADRLMRSALVETPAQRWAQHVGAPATDIEETANEYVLTLDLPGHSPDSVNVKVDGDTLTVQSERKHAAGDRRPLRNERAFGVFARSFVLPDTVDASKCDAKLEQGVLTITLGKREEAKPRTISIKVQG
jgi:HSP20 family protein